MTYCLMKIVNLLVLNIQSILWLPLLYVLCSFLVAWSLDIWLIMPVYSLDDNIPCSFALNPLFVLISNTMYWNFDYMSMIFLNKSFGHVMMYVFWLSTFLIKKVWLFGWNFWYAFVFRFSEWSVYIDNCEIVLIFLFNCGEEPSS